MSASNARMEAYVRQQLELGREAWWIVDVVSRRGGVPKSDAQGLVDRLEAEVKPSIARFHVLHMGIGLFLMAFGLLAAVALLMEGWISFLALAMAGGGFVEASWGWSGWRRNSKLH